MGDCTPLYVGGLWQSSMPRSAFISCTS